MSGLPSHEGEARTWGAPDETREFASARARLRAAAADKVQFFAKVNSTSIIMGWECQDFFFAHIAHVFFAIFCRIYSLGGAGSEPHHLVLPCLS